MFMTFSPTFGHCRFRRAHFTIGLSFQQNYLHENFPTDTSSFKVRRFRKDYVS